MIIFQRQNLQALMILLVDVSVDQLNVCNDCIKVTQIVQMRSPFIPMWDVIILRNNCHKKLSMLMGTRNLMVGHLPLSAPLLDFHCGRQSWMNFARWANQLSLDDDASDSMPSQLPICALMAKLWSTPRQPLRIHPSSHTCTDCSELSGQLRPGLGR